MKHTHKKWHCFQSTESSVCAIQNQNSELIAKTSDTFNLTNGPIFTREEHLANAKLIAAAPELLRTLSNLAYDGSAKNIKAAKDAIRNAI